MPRIRVHILLTLSLVTALALAACVGASALMATPAPAIALTPCQLSAPDSVARIKAKCGTLIVFENLWWLFGCISGSRCCLGDKGRRWLLPRRETL